MDILIMIIVTLWAAFVGFVIGGIFGFNLAMANYKEVDLEFEEYAQAYESSLN